MQRTVEQVLQHYREEAEKYGPSKQSTMKDAHVRDMEVSKIVECLSHFSEEKKKLIPPGYCLEPRILEVGCGNGYTAEQIVKLANLSLKGIDLCEPMIRIARRRRLGRRLGVMTFEVGDVTSMKFKDESFDIVFSERCLINLVSWENQKKALNEIHRVLTFKGVFLMVEAFTDGLDDLNRARDAVGLPPIPMPSFDLYLDKKEFFEYIFKFEDLKWCPPNFLSTYYFGTRVIYPALIAGRKEWVANNMFDEFYTHLPPYGNYSPIQIYVLQKKR